MNLSESVRIALRALRLNKMRTGLTMLGIIIGVAAVIAMVGIGQGAAKQIKDQFASMGTNMLMVSRGGSHSRPGPGSTSAPPVSLVPADAEAIASRFPDTIAAVAQVCRGNGDTKLGDKVWSTNVIGATPEYETVAKWPVSEGNFVSATDQEGRSRVAVVGRTLIENLTGDRSTNLIGQTIQINRTQFTVIGILQEKGSGAFGQDQDDIVIIPCSTAMRRVFNRTYLNEIDVMCVTEGDMDLATEQITNLMRERHKLRPPFPDNDDFTVRNQAQILAASAQSSSTMTALLGGIALVSLLVGGIGIMNIMLVSVTERTREIGIRKAVGATGHHIMIQFLIEAVVISILGGIIGVALGLTLARLGAVLLNLAPLVSTSTVLLAVAVSAAIGIFFGIYPARKAAHLNPIDALRFE
ncbi:MAG TPA: ABC transporter permease [Armatimonadota bacterium]